RAQQIVQSTRSHREPLRFLPCGGEPDNRIAVNMYVAALPTKMSYESSSQPLSRRVTPTIRQNLRKSALSTFSCRDARLEAEFRLGNISPVFPYPTGDVERLSLDREGHATVTSIDVDLQHERPSSLLL